MFTSQALTRTWKILVRSFIICTLSCILVRQLNYMDEIRGTSIMYVGEKKCEKKLSSEYLMGMFSWVARF